MPSHSTTSSRAGAASRGRSSKSAGGPGSASQAQRSKGRSTNGNRAKRELAGGLKTARTAAPIDDDIEIESDEDAELEMTEGKLRKQSEQRWSARMNALAPNVADSDQGEGELSE